MNPGPSKPIVHINVLLPHWKYLVWILQVYKTSWQELSLQDSCQEPCHIVPYSFHQSLSRSNKRHLVRFLSRTLQYLALTSNDIRETPENVVKILWRRFPYQGKKQGLTIETSQNLIKERFGDKEQLHDSQLSLMSNAQANCSVWYRIESIILAHCVLTITLDTYKCKTKL